MATPTCPSERLTEMMSVTSATILSGSLANAPQLHQTIERGFHALRRGRDRLRLRAPAELVTGLLQRDFLAGDLLDDRCTDYSDMLNGFAIALAMKHLRLRSRHTREVRHVGRKYAIELDARQRRSEPCTIPMMPVLQGGRVLGLADNIARPCPLDRTVTQGDDTCTSPAEITAVDESLSVSHSLGRWTASVVGRLRLDH